MKQLTRSLSTIVLLIGFQIIGFSQSVALSVGSVSAIAGTIVSLPINLTSSGGAQAAGLQWSFPNSSDITIITVTAGPAATNAGKSLTCSANNCLLVGFNSTAIGDGTVATASFQIASNPSTASIPVQISGVIASTAAGDSIPASGSSGAISILAQPPTVSVGISPLNATLTASQSTQFTATVTGSSTTSVIWSMTPPTGTLSNGSYTAPSVINTAQSVTVTATSVADPSKSASAVVQLAPTVSVGISPLNATLKVSQSTQFTATVNVIWSMIPSTGTLSNGLYTAPSVINNAQSVIVTATSVADPSKSASAVVQLKLNVGGGHKGAVNIEVPTSQSTFNSAKDTINIAGTAPPNTSEVVWATDQGGHGQAIGTLDWVVNGIVLRNGSNRITVTARDGAGNLITSALTVVYSSPTIVTTSLPNGRVGKLYSAKLAAVGGTPPFTWSAVSMPNTLTLSKDGVIAGTPGAEGTFTLTVTIEDSEQVSTTASIRMRIDNGLVLVSAASLIPGPVAPGSMVTAFGDQLAGGALSATVRPLPTTLGDDTVTVKDANGVERRAGLYFVSPNQINFQIPPETAVGSSTVTVMTGDQIQTFPSLTISTIAPGLFFLNSDGLAAADLTRVTGNSTTYEQITELDNTTNLPMAIPIDLGSDRDTVYLTLYGTGFRNRPSLDSVQVLIADGLVPVDYAGPSTTSDGMDLVHVLLPKGLRGTGNATVVVTVNGVSSNGVSVVIK